MTQVNADKQEEITDDIHDALSYIDGHIESGPVEGNSFPLIYRDRGTVVECTVTVDDINVYYGEA